MSETSIKKNIIKNTMILSIGNFLTKAVSFFLLPLYTSVLSKADYGISDLIQNISYLLIPFIGLQIGSGLFRFIINKNDKEERKEIVSFCFFILLIISIVFLIIMFVINKLLSIPYSGLFSLYFISMLFSEFVSRLLRGLRKDTLYAACSFLNTLIYIILNLFFILNLKMGGESIIISLSLGSIISGIIFLSLIKVWELIDLRSINKEKGKEILSYSIPLIPNAISWGIVNVSDRVIISKFLNVAENGIYAVANKFPVIFTTFFSALDMAWVEALSEINDIEERKNYISENFQSVFVLLADICILLICVISIIFKFFVGKEFIEAYNHTYILVVAIFFNSISSLYGGIFVAYKDSKTISKTTVYGAITNIIINISLIKIIGLYAASISTLVSYFVIFFVRNIKLKKYVEIKWNVPKLISLVILLTIVSIGYFISNDILNIIILLIMFIWTIYSNRKTLDTILLTIKRGISR